MNATRFMTEARPSPTGVTAPRFPVGARVRFAVGMTGNGTEADVIGAFGDERRILFVGAGGYPTKEWRHVDQLAAVLR